MSQFNRHKIHTFPLSERKHKLEFASIAVSPDGINFASTLEVEKQIVQAVEHIRAARIAGKPVMLTYGAHLIKNGMAPVIIRLLEEGYVTHVATNGAGSIHDWEFAYFGKSTEDVRANVAEGKFGIWEETGKFINLAVAVGGTHGLGYGASIGRMIAEDGLMIPTVDELRASIANATDEKIGAFADLLYMVTTFNIPAGFMEIRHLNKSNAVQYAAYKLGIPFTVHPGIGYDIIYTHPMNCGGAIGRGSVWDFLTYTDTISKLQDGVHLSVGSAIMAPMIFEKALSMAKNVAMQTGEKLDNYYLVINDIQDGGGWNWNNGEPPMDNPAYYLRFCKSFYRMGGELDYICLDNRAFLLGLYDGLRKG